MNTRPLLFLAGALFLVGCGGDGSSNPAQTPLDTSAFDVLSYGTVTRFGSVYVNGAVFECDAATVTMNGEPAHISDLRVGHVVSVSAAVQSQGGDAAARAIGCRDAAVGPITDLDPDGNRFAVLGRDVLFDELTVFENNGYEELANGNVVRVMGHERYRNRIQATLIEQVANAWADGMLVKVNGELADLDPGLMRFRIGRQWCDYSSAMLDLGGADLANGLYVEAQSTAPIADGDLILDQLRSRDRDRYRNKLCGTACTYEIEGYITDYVSPLQFIVDRTTVTTTEATTYLNGSIDTLALDARVAVSGSYDDQGVLDADKIVFRLPSAVQIEADVEAVDIGEAALTLLGIRVKTSDATLFRDARDAGVGDFWLDDLAVGDRVAMRARLQGQEVLATRVERQDANDQVTLKAPVEWIDRPLLTLLGVTVAARDDTLYQAGDKTVIDGDAFFALVQAGTLIRAVGTLNGATIMADRLAIRECENSCL